MNVSKQRRRPTISLWKTSTPRTRYIGMMSDLMHPCSIEFWNFNRAEYVTSIMSCIVWKGAGSWSSNGTGTVCVCACVCVCVWTPMKESLQGKNIGERSTIVSAEWANADKIKWRERLKNVCMNMSMFIYTQLLYSWLLHFFKARHGKQWWDPESLIPFY